MFSAEQVKQLAAPLDRAHVRKRDQGGRELSYVEGWYVIDTANHIFGFDKWKRETVRLECVSTQTREIGARKVPGWEVTYFAKVRVTVEGVVREGVGFGHGIDRSCGQAHESAGKEAETDAMKRALMTFGNPFGLALYDKNQAQVTEPAPRQPLPPQKPVIKSRIGDEMGDEGELESKRKFIETCEAKIAKWPIAHLRSWWQSPAHVRDLRMFELTQAEVDKLKELVIKRLEQKSEGAA